MAQFIWLKRIKLPFYQILQYVDIIAAFHYSLLLLLLVLSRSAVRSHINVNSFMLYIYTKS